MTAATFDPYALEDGPPPVADTFRPSLVARAAKRKVTFVAADGEWSVTGDSKLGDSRSCYTVSFNGTAKKYDCDCYHSDHGKSRAKKICSHVLAVIMHRRDQAAEVAAKINGTPSAERSAAGAGVDPVGREDRGATAPVPVRVNSAPPSPRDPTFGSPPIPAHFSSIRDHQWAAVQFIIDEFETKDLVFVEAPTGAGKTLIGELVRRLQVQAHGGKTVYACSSIQLQQQFLDDFDYARVIKGRGNYPTAAGPTEVSCADCTASPPDDPECMWCPTIDLCPYRVAKSRAGAAELAVLNTSYLLHVTNHTHDFVDRDLYVVDEADTLEQSLMGFVEVSISERMVKDLDLGQPKFVTKPESWQEWLKKVVIPKVGEELESLPHQTDDLRLIRRKRNLSQLIGRLVKVEKEVAAGGWVFDDYQRGGATFRPIKVDSFGNEFLWRHGKKWLLMSATIISPDQMAESLGWQRDFGVVRVPSTFPVENRPIIVAPVARMTGKQEVQDVEWPKMATAIANVLDRHPDERVLVHTVSYKLMQYLADELKNAGVTRTILTYNKANERDGVLARYRRTPGAVLLAPSMDRGVDLPYDDCRVVIVAKLPFLSLGDKQVNARLYSPGGQQWYTVEAIRSLIQGTGRGVRSATDTCTTYLLDQVFTSMWRKNRVLLPSWWQESLVWTFPVREITRPR